MKKTLFTIATLVCIVLTFGCRTMVLSDQQKEDVTKLNKNGIAWSTLAADNRLEPPVCMGAAVAWSFIPGSSQIFICHKLADAELVEGEQWEVARRREVPLGISLFLVSWYPYVYPFTQIFGMVSTISDVNNINNLVMLDKYNQGEFDDLIQDPSMRKSTAEVEPPTVEPKPVEASAPIAKSEPIAKPEPAPVVTPAAPIVKVKPVATPAEEDPAPETPAEDSDTDTMPVHIVKPIFK